LLFGQCCFSNKLLFWSVLFSKQVVSLWYLHMPTLNDLVCGFPREETRLSHIFIRLFNLISMGCVRLHDISHIIL
jgi:hypothetical protein